MRRRRLEWMKAHRAEYGGQHVALDGAALVAVGQTYREAKEKALAAGHPAVFVTYLPKPDEVADCVATASGGSDRLETRRPKFSSNFTDFR